jgi:hypothetical protein
MYFPKLAITSLAAKKGILSSSDVELIGAGEEMADFFHVDSVKEAEWKRINRSYQALYKMLPLFTPRALKYFIARNMQRKLHRLPHPVVVLLQLLVAIRGRDYRFILYIRYYGRRIKRWLKVRWKLEA